LGLVGAGAFPVTIGNSHLRFMLVSYAVKQLEHSRSMLKLHSSLDTLLIARSMLEGLVQLLWALRQPRRRPLMWRAFAFVLDWRLLQRQRANGTPVDPEVARHTKWGLQRYGRWFLTKDAKTARGTGAALPPDPYARNWYGERETDLFRAIGGEELLRGAYVPFSEWHHWRPGAIGRAISFDKGSSTFAMSTSDPSYAAMSYAAGFQCLWQTLRILNRRCRLHIGIPLRDLKRRQVALRTSGTPMRAMRPTITRLARSLR
jgi:hypothetical protein